MDGRAPRRRSGGDRWLRFFGEGLGAREALRPGDREALRALLGGKGAGLAEMTAAGLPVPPGFTITTEVCRAFYAEKGRRRLSRAQTPLAQLRLFPNGFLREFMAAMARLERATGRRLGDPDAPLLVSVRSGAKFSMPGMMDTILNLGLNERTVLGLERQTQNPRFAWDCYRRFVQMFGNVVRGIEKSHFETVLESIKARARLTEDSELSTQSLRKAAAVFQEIYRERTGTDFPQDPYEQLRLAVVAVLESWNNPRAIAYRRLNRIPEDLGTACNIQAMVFGNMGETSATGVGFTRDPNTGEREFFGEFLPNAQGEDVVAGSRTPKPIRQLARELPQAHRRLLRIAGRLERQYRDVQDIEFTVERGRLFMLQTRSAKRTAQAALRVAVDMVQERLIRRDEAVQRVSPEQLEQLLKPVFDAQARADFPVVARGLAAGPGAACGRIALSAERAVAVAKDGPVLLVRPETNPDDILGMSASQGILTGRGGLTSHAAVEGRGMGKVCVVGCSEMDFQGDEIRMDGHVYREGDWLSLDGFTGEVIHGQVPTRPSLILRALQGDAQAARAELFAAYRTFMGWVDASRRLGVRANADTPEDARIALALGAEGIGLCRTEHMFFGEERIPKMLRMILAETEEERYRALGQLFPLQK
ncbi:MAG: pyruvate, phosphate dikinase, partial [Elusimicrobia bacterium]|nr:pyruvate, phosphate dikinase [Elusimicrobiota bacterium]